MSSFILTPVLSPAAADMLSHLEKGICDVTRGLSLLQTHVMAYKRYSDTETDTSIDSKKQMRLSQPTTRAKMRQDIYMELSHFRISIQELGLVSPPKDACERLMGEVQLQKLLRAHHQMFKVVTACDDAYFREMYAALPPLPVS